MTRAEFLALATVAQKNEDLRRLFRQSPGEGSLKARCIRPDHPDATPSMVIACDHVYCYGCGSFWWPDQFLSELGDRALMTTPTPHVRQVKPRQIPLAMVQTYNKWLNTHYRDRLEWLFARGLRLEDAINLNKLGHDGQAFVIPILDGTTVQALRFRRDDVWADDLEDPERPKYWGLYGRNEVALYKPLVPESASLQSDTVYFCEGELDALRLAQEGLTAWSLTNGARSFRPEHVRLFQGRRVKVVYDQDGPGRAASARVCRLLGARNVIWPEVLGKDVTEFLQRWSLPALLNHL